MEDDIAMLKNCIAELRATSAFLLYEIYELKNKKRTPLFYLKQTALRIKQEIKNNIQVFGGFQRRAISE